jgi:hypothetical protein
VGSCDRPADVDKKQRILWRLNRCMIRAYNGVVSVIANSKLRVGKWSEDSCWSGGGEY